MLSIRGNQATLSFGIHNEHFFAITFDSNNLDNAINYIRSLSDMDLPISAEQCEAVINTLIIEFMLFITGGLNGN